MNTKPTGAKASSKEIIIGRVPAEGGDLQLLSLLKLELPERKQGALKLSKLVGSIFVESEV